MAFFNDEDIESDESFEDDPKELYGVREGTIFVIDATSPMFKNDPDNPYFLQCVKQYKEVLKQKLVWDRQDWIGLILFGTEESDKDLRHILTLHSLSVATVQNLKDVRKIDEGKKWEHYRDIASPTAYPLHDALQHAARAFSAIRLTMSMRRVILFTCQDNPPITDDNEKHRIRRQAKSFSDIGLQLFVVGLGENWNHDSFYKDLEMSSRKIDADDYKRMSLKDVLEQVKVPSKNMAKLPWRLGENVIVDVALRSLSIKSSYLKTSNVSKENNIPLTPNTYYVHKNSDTEDVEDEESQQKLPVLETNIQKFQTFGNEKICFTPAEVKSMCVTREKGIDLICIQPSSHHPLYHVETPYFVMPGKSYREDNKLLFGALLNKCDEKNLMIICVVTLRNSSASSLYTMIPNAKNGGFYLYKIPFKENVRDISKYFSNYIYNDERKPPIDPKGVEVLEQLIGKLSFEYNPKLFLNPKLQVQLQTVEILALDLEKLEPPPDTTCPTIDKMRKLADNLSEKYDTIFPTDINDTSDAPPKKKSKKSDESIETSNLNKDKIQEFVKSGQIVNFTAVQLKDILKTLGLKTSGKKDELINRIKSHF